MKALVLFITAVFVAAVVNLFTPKPIPHNETESANHICAISKTDFDYVIHMIDVGSVYRIGDKRKAFIGTYDNGIEFDGDNAYQYIDNLKTPIDSFPFKHYDSDAERILAIVQKIISEKLYSAYPDERENYAEIYYYFKISKEGLALFQDRNYVYGLISCYYEKYEFRLLNLSLKPEEDERPTVWYTFGTIDSIPSVLP